MGCLLSLSSHNKSSKSIQPINGLNAPIQLFIPSLNSKEILRKNSIKSETPVEKFKRILEKNENSLNEEDLISLTDTIFEMT